MDRTALRRFPPASSGAGVSCSQARQATRHLLAEMDVHPERAADALTVVTELVSNAHRHADGVTAFRVSPRPGAVVVEVSDASGRLPHERPWSPTRPGGFGWLLVNRLSDSTDVRFHRGGKTVMAKLNTGHRMR